MAKTKQDYVNEGRAAFALACDVTKGDACTQANFQFSANNASNAWQSRAWVDGWLIAQREASERDEAEAQAVVALHLLFRRCDGRMQLDDERANAGTLRITYMDEAHLPAPDTGDRFTNALNSQVIGRAVRIKVDRVIETHSEIVRIPVPIERTGVKNAPKRERDAAKRTKATIKRCRTRVANMIAFAAINRANRTHRGISNEQIVSSNIRRAEANQHPKRRGKLSATFDGLTR